MALTEYQSTTIETLRLNSNNQDVNERNDWKVKFKQLFESAVVRYQAGERDLSAIFEEQDVEFLASIGTRHSRSTIMWRIGLSWASPPLRRF